MLRTKVTKSNFAENSIAVYLYSEMASNRSSATQAWYRVSGLCGRIRRDIRTLEEESDPHIHDIVIDSLILQIDILLQHLHGLGTQEEVIVECASALGMLSRLTDERELHYPRLQVGFVNSTGPGRPRYNISREQLEHLLHLHFDFPTMLGVSLRTIRRRMAEHNLSVRAHYSDIDDEELNRTVKDIKEQFPNCGYCMMDGLLRQRGINIQQMRVREVMQSRDPNGTVVLTSFSEESTMCQVPNHSGTLMEITN